MANNPSSILQSLTAAYTDSEGEEEIAARRRSASDNSDENEDKESGGPVIATPESNKSGTNTPQSGSSISGKLTLILNQNFGRIKFGTTYSFSCRN